MQCSGVADAHAITAADADGKMCVVVIASPALSSDALMAELADYLPSVYMPAAAVTLPSLPALPNGKIDRKRLQVSPLHDRYSCQTARSTASGCG